MTGEGYTQTTVRGKFRPVHPLPLYWRGWNENRKCFVAKRANWANE